MSTDFFFYNPKSDFKIVILKIQQGKAVRCLLGISNEKSFKYLGVYFHNKDMTTAPEPAALLLRKHSGGFASDSKY